MWCARSVCEIRSSCLHLRIVFPGWSDRAISPAIFSRSGNCMPRARKRAIYKRVEETIDACRTAHSSSATKLRRSEARSTGSHNAYRRASASREAPWVRGGVWSILGGSGPLDSGSNPDGPTEFRSGPGPPPSHGTWDPQRSSRGVLSCPGPLGNPLHLRRMRVPDVPDDAHGREDHCEAEHLGHERFRSVAQNED